MQVDVDNSVAESYTIYANVPLLADPPAGWELVLVDTPGFGDASMNNVVASAEMLLTTSSIYLYVIDSGSTGDAVDAKNLWNIFNRDASKVMYIYTMHLYCVHCIIIKT